MLRSIVPAVVLSLLIPALLPRVATSCDKKKDPVTEEPKCGADDKQPAAPAKCKVAAKKTSEEPKCQADAQPSAKKPACTPANKPSVKKPPCKPDAKKTPEEPKCRADAQPSAKKPPCKPAAKPSAKKPPCKPDAKKIPEKPKCRADAQPPAKEPSRKAIPKPASKPPGKPKPEKPVERPKDKPTVKKPTVKKPAVEKPAVEKPAVAKPAAKKPAAKKPAVKKPTVEKPAAKKPAVEKPAVAKPAVKKPAVEKPAVKKPAVEKPAVAKPAVKKPAVEKPAVKKPTVKKPAVKKPAVEKPAVEKPAVKKPTVTKPTVQPEEKPVAAKPADTPPEEGPAEKPVVVSAPRVVESSIQQAEGPAPSESSLGSFDADFPFQGEYGGATYTARLGHEMAGLQVAALGDGQFRGVQYRFGLPGSGWNGYDQILLQGRREGDTVWLEAHGPLGTYTILIRDGFAELRNSAWQLLGRLEKVERVSPTMGAAAPAGAIILFDGSSVDEFDSGEIVEGGLLLAGPITKREFRDFHLHVEFRTPYMPAARGQGRGNSGCYLQKRYEVQILDSFSLSGEANECGGLYRQRPPEVNMALPPLTWQTYDIDFTAARFDDTGKKTENARITVLHNGVAVHHDVELPNKTGAGNAESPAPGPIRFQWHGNPVHFRNLWIVDKSAG